MSIAHLQVESLDAALKETKKGFASFNKKERGQVKREFKEKSNLMDGAYSELKRAQDALNKSIVQNEEIENALAQMSRQTKLKKWKKNSVNGK